MEVTEQRRVPGPGPPGQGAEVRHHPGAEGIEVDVPQDDKAVVLPLEGPGLEAVLVEVAAAAVAAVEVAGVAGAEPVHDPGEGRGPRYEQPLVSPQLPHL
jgi:hypothetical protein